MAFDYKKEYREFYMPKDKPEIVEIPAMNFIAVRGKGNPNEEGGEYKASIGLLYSIAFTIKMSKKGKHRIEGYFDYVVPPLEGFWWQEERHPADAAGKGGQASTEAGLTDGLTGGEGGFSGLDYGNKESFRWISVIRLPDFVTRADFDWAVSEAMAKAAVSGGKKKEEGAPDYSKVEFLTIQEGLCVQCMHVGSFDEEPATIALMDRYLQENGYENDFSGERRHHEIYLSDARRVAPERWKTVIRHPVRKK